MEILHRECLEIAKKLWFGEASSTNCLQKISSSEKYVIFQNHLQLHNSYVFPKSILYECQGTCKQLTNGSILWNPGNVLATVRQITHCYLLSYEHIHSLLRKDVSYMSPASRNEIIVAKYILQIWVIEEIE